MTNQDEHSGQRTGASSPDFRARPVNPYIAGAPVSGAEMFYGRDDVFEFIRNKLIGQHRDTPIVLKGERRAGKTSVLYQVRRHLDPSYRCLSIDVHGLSLAGIGDLLHQIASAVSDGLHSDYGLEVAPPDRSAFETDARSAFESDFLPAVLTALGEDHLVLMLDEVSRLDDEIRAGRLDREIFSYLRHLMQNYPRLNFIFSLGSGLEEMRKDYAFLFSATMYHRISFLTETAARKLITEPVRERFEVAPDAVNAILRVTSGHPYYTQLVCHSLFDRWASGPPRPVMTAEDVEAVLAEAIELGSPNLTYVWEDSSPEEKAVMAGMAAAAQDDSRAVTSKAIRRAWSKARVPLPERKLSAALRNLASREVITDTAPYAFTVDLQRRWLDKHRRLEWLKGELADPIQQWKHETRPSRTLRLAAATATPVVLITALLAIILFPRNNHPIPKKVTLSPSAQLAQMLPADIRHPSTECQKQDPNNLTISALPAHTLPVPAAKLRVLYCQDPGLKGTLAGIWVYQTDSFDYADTWAAFNSQWRFDPTKATKSCPPIQNDGVTQWHNREFPVNPTQEVECADDNVPSHQEPLPMYLWTYPTQNTFIFAQGSLGQPINSFDKWWKTNIENR